MTLHTIIPLDIVTQGLGQEAEERTYVEITSGRLRLQLEPVYPGVGRIVRLVDGPLNDYLRPELAPGMLFAYGRPEDGATFS
ncbi:hypothetical protein BG53_11990 [Paenibacillus darwinianus]|uniref:YlzJ-like protein n=1 Tax=Paenibacillus darwinianus TaxID=1380763 RepID=A0A9W5S358_9BACL|nr:YlzJ-like family protein [Paenibacillus darwinianus]EXX91224.1 hypothetical protein BG53_11990 [Paenibacillus darwinianus]EXX92154.1 hypothetical protein BG52_01140 [Paenibacillus darwinianus]EXX92805.1 hypothetical protein CH50_14510 [Paenibacillus darwinianus]